MLYKGTRVRFEGKLGHVETVSLTEGRIVVTVSLDNGTTVETSGDRLTQVFFNKAKS